jgi:hypothetical protein
MVLGLIGAVISETFWFPWDNPWWHEATLEDYAFYVGLLALGIIAILFHVFRQRVPPRDPEAPETRDD